MRGPHLCTFLFVHESSSVLVIGINHDFDLTFDPNTKLIPTLEFSDGTLLKMPSQLCTNFENRVKK